MWDSLGKSVDINLDNLSRHSKGSKNTATNVPMNLLMSGGNQTPLNLGRQTSSSSANQFNFSTPPMSPNANFTTTAPPQPPPPSTADNRSLNLLDF
jgi:hypothetical protein